MSAAANDTSTAAPAAPVIVQLSDPHIGAAWQGVDPVPRWRAAIDAVRRLAPSPAAILLTGDLTEHGSEDDYDVVAAGLAEIGAPAHILAGNHDARAPLRRRFGLDGAPGAPIHQAVDIGGLRLVTLDTTRPGSPAGELAPAQLDWLDAELAAASGRPTLLAMHHPPFALGIPAWDAIGLAEPDRTALAAILRRHDQVRLIVAGHVHRLIVGACGGRRAMTAPSTYLQARLRFGAEEIELVDLPGGFLVHAFDGHEITSHLEPVTAAAGP